MDEVMTIKIQEIALNVQSVKSGMLRKSLQHHSSKQSMQSIRNINVIRKNCQWVIPYLTGNFCGILQSTLNRRN